MLMSQGGRPAKLHYMANTFRMLAPGDHVVCAVTGQKIPVENWFVVWFRDHRRGRVGCFLHDSV